MRSFLLIHLGLPVALIPSAAFLAAGITDRLHPWLALPLAAVLLLPALRLGWSQTRATPGALASAVMLLAVAVWWFPWSAMPGVMTWCHPARHLAYLPIIGSIPPDVSAQAELLFPVVWALLSIEGILCFLVARLCGERRQSEPITAGTWTGVCIAYALLVVLTLAPAAIRQHTVNRLEEGLSPARSPITLPLARVSAGRGVSPGPLAERMARSRPGGRADLVMLLDLLYYPDDPGQELFAGRLVDHLLQLAPDHFPAQEWLLEVLRLRPRRLRPTWLVERARQLTEVVRWQRPARVTHLRPSWRTGLSPSTLLTTWWQLTRELPGILDEREILEWMREAGTSPSHRRDLVHAFGLPPWVPPPPIATDQEWQEWFERFQDHLCVRRWSLAFREVLVTLDEPPVTMPLGLERTAQIHILPGPVGASGSTFPVLVWVGVSDGSPGSLSPGTEAVLLEAQPDESAALPQGRTLGRCALKAITHPGWPWPDRECPRFWAAFEVPRSAAEGRHARLWVVPPQEPATPPFPLLPDEQ